jgi:hypothetical protein
VTVTTRVPRVTTDIDALTFGADSFRVNDALLAIEHGVATIGAPVTFVGHAVAVIVATIAGLG